MTTIIKNCKHCNNTFEASLKEHNRGFASFCNKDCYKLFKRPVKTRDDNVHCSYCNTTFYKSISKMQNSKSGLYFCSRTCKDTAQKLGGIKEIQPPHYGVSLRGNSSTYRRIAFTAYGKKCNRCDYNKHPEILEVHHIDRNRSNNTETNLEVLCPNCHNEEHFLAKDGRY